MLKRKQNGSLREKKTISGKNRHKSETQFVIEIADGMDQSINHVFGTFKQTFENRIAKFICP